MCQVAVYLDKEKIAEDVIWIEPSNDGMQIRTFFDDPIYVKGKIQSIDLIKNRVHIVSDQDKIREDDSGS